MSFEGFIFTFYLSALITQEARKVEDILASHIKHKCIILKIPKYLLNS